jgi:hypothetical protein
MAATEASKIPGVRKRKIIMEKVLLKNVQGWPPSLVEKTGWHRSPVRLADRQLRRRGDGHLKSLNSDFLTGAKPIRRGRQTRKPLNLKG